MPQELPIREVRDGGRESLLRLTYVFSAFAQTRVSVLNSDFHKAILDADGGNPRQMAHAQAILRRIYSELYGPLKKSKADKALRECEDAVNRAAQTKGLADLPMVEEAHLVLMEHATRLGFNGQFTPADENMTAGDLLDHTLDLGP